MGGTFIPTKGLSADEIAELDEKEIRRMLDRNSEFFRGVSYYN
jgi:hypothetical protein